MEDRQQTRIYGLGPHHLPDRAFNPGRLSFMGQSQCVDNQE